MTEPDGDKNQGENGEGLFKIMDEIIAQVNKTKKMLIVIILTTMIIPPISFAVSFQLLGPPPPPNGGSPPPGPEPDFSRIFGFPKVVPILISLAWLGVGIRQWFVLSKWTKKYERYKKLQDEIDKKLED
jgi:hypothetical protein